MFAPHRETIPIVILKALGSFFCLCRSYLITIVLRRCGVGLKVRSNIKISGSRNIYCGKNCNIGRNVELDASAGELHIGNNVEIRDNVRIYAKKIAIGDNVTIGESSYLNGHIEIASRAWISRGCDFTGLIRIGRSILGPKTAIISGDHRRDLQTKEILMSGEGSGSQVVIEDGAWTGHGAIILKGVTIRKNMVVGAGSVVTKTYGEGDVVAGNPACPIRSKLALKGL